MTHFDKKIWNQEFVSNKFDTAWKCGACGIGSLKLESEIKTKKSTYAIHIICTDYHCRKRYALIGEITFTARNIKVTREYFRIDDYRLYPTQFQPELVMFGLPLSMKDEIKLKLVKSFNHFWYDLDACANKIRQAIELIIDEKGGIGSSLDQKIKSLEAVLGSNLTDTIIALKWIGNEGSHASRPFQRDEILDTYSLLVDVLSQLYPDESERERRESLVRLVNEKKGIKNL